MTEAKMQPELAQLLERYHDGEVSADEIARVESLLESDAAALTYLGTLDEMATSYREVVADQMAGVQFDGLWTQIHAQIQTEVATPAVVEQGLGAKVGAFLKSIFADHKGAWIAAATTACAVAAVMSFVGNPTTERVIEKQIIIVESVDQMDQDNMVLVNSLSDDNTAVIWMLPNKAAGDEADQNEDSEGDSDIVIEDEPL
jgi:hypothetical protein